MSAICTRDQLLELIRKSRILEGAVLEEFLVRERETGGASRDADNLAERLVQCGLLTRFQTKLLLQGKWRGFFLAEKYKILSLLGAGGAGRVYLCEHRQLQRRVAVKVLPGDRTQNSEHLARFYREARAVAALNHPNIVRVFDIDQCENVHYMVLEHVDGRGLNDIVALKGPLAVDRAAHYISQAAAGLHHAHTAGWIHRDIKPGNILLERTGVIKVLDLGLARLFAEADSLTSTGDPPALLGTADYISPEQALSAHSVDARADIYGLGATFYYLVCGRPPVPKGSLANKLLWHQVQTPERVTKVRPDAPADIERVIERMMAKDRAARYQTMAEVIQALERWTKSPIGPPPAEEMPPQGSSGSHSEATPVSLSTSATVIATARSTTVVEDRTRRPFSAIARLQKAHEVLRNPAAVPSSWIATSAAVVLFIFVGIIVWMTAGPSGPASPGKLSAHPGEGVVNHPPAKGSPETRPATYRPCPDFRGSTPVLPGRSPLRVSREGNDGSYRTIAQALAKAVEGDVIHVETPDARWEERLTIREIAPNVTLEGHDPTGAGRPVEWNVPEGQAEEPLLRIEDVKRFKFRGFRLSGRDHVNSLVVVSGRCPGLALEDLWLEGFRAHGVLLNGAQGERDAPIRLQRLRVIGHVFSKAEAAVALAPAKDLANANVRIVDCRFEGPFEAVLRVSGPLVNLEFVGNRAFKVDAIFACLLADRSFPLRMVVRSNTFCEVSNAFLHLDTLPKDEEHRIVLDDNLFLVTGAFARVNGASPRPEQMRGFFTSFSGNLLDEASMRDADGNLPAGLARSAFSPLAIDPDDDAGFLRYPWTSPLRTAGTGGHPVGVAPLP